MHRSPTVTLPSEPILVPVVDLLAGQVVHARRGERSRYQPIQSPLCPGSDLLPLARAGACDIAGSNPRPSIETSAIQVKWRSLRRRRDMPTV